MNEKTKQINNNLLAFVIGVLTAYSLFLYGYAKQESNPRPAIAITTNQSTGNIEKGEIGDPKSDGEGGIGISTKIEGTKTDGGTQGSGDGSSKETNQGGEKLILVKGFPEDSLATRIATYAYEISNGDIDFLATLKAENGAFDMYKQSNFVKNGVREDSWGLCQLHRGWHKDIVDSKIFWESWEYQVRVCYEKYKGGTRFYGYDVRHRYLNDFTILPI